MADDPMDKLDPDKFHERRRLRARRKRRRAYIRSIYLLPSMATLGNAVCGFAAIYIASLSNDGARDPWTKFFIEHRFIVPAYLIFLAMLFDALDGRLARFTRHTTDFGGQLDSMADVISFGVAPAVIMLQLCRSLPDLLWAQLAVDTPFALTRAIWAVGSLYVSCAAIRLARFNVSNQHGEQHHFSFLGLPSPAAAGTVAAFTLMCMSVGEKWVSRLAVGQNGFLTESLRYTYLGSLCLLPVVTLFVGLLMVSTIRYPHLVNRYLRGKKSVGRLVAILIVGGLILAFYQYAIALAMLVYVVGGLWSWAMARRRGARLGESPAAAR